MSTKAKRHVHKYYRVTTKIGKIWACALPDCNHHMPQHYEEMLPGRNSRCWECDETFQLDTTNMRDDKPKCANCTFGPMIDELEGKQIEIDTTKAREEAKQLIKESGAKEPEFAEELCKQCGMGKVLKGAKPEDNPNNLCYMCFVKALPPESSSRS